MIYGSRDPSFPYVGMLDRVDSEVCSYRVMESVDHCFTNEAYFFQRIITHIIVELS